MMLERPYDAHFKIMAAQHHLRAMHYVYNREKPGLDAWAKNYPREPSPDTFQPFYYYFDAFLYELVSCFDMILQYVNIKYNLGVPMNQVSWRRSDPFRPRLAQQQPEVYRVIDSAHQDQWYQELLNTRNSVAHRGTIGLMIEYTDDDGIHYVGIPGLSHEFFERCEIWGTKLSELLERVEQMP